MTQIVDPASIVLKTRNVSSLIAAQMMNVPAHVLLATTMSAQLLSVVQMMIVTAIHPSLSAITIPISVLAALMILIPSCAAEDSI